jgi:hypothetical protein
MAYQVAKPSKPAKAKKKTVYLFASGDLRPAANQACWAAQKEMEDSLTEVITAAGYKVQRAHPVKPEGHGFLASQKEGIETFAAIDPKAPVIVAEAVWQYSHHVLPGLTTHQGPILTVANWSGTWPGLVGMLNLNASLTKAGVKFSTLWSENFVEDKKFVQNMNKWLEKGLVRHPIKHVKPFKKVKVGAAESRLGQSLADQLFTEKAIMGIFDEGCMGMYNAIIPDDLLMKVGVFKERLSQSALYYETTQVTDKEAADVRAWFKRGGMTFVTGKNEETDLTESQILIQCKMYVAAMRIADDFGCDLIGIQYQQGLKDLLPASDLVEGTLNNADRPPVKSRDGKRILLKGEPLVHFNEVDECAGLDGLMTYRIHKAMDQPVESTLHDVRWGDWDPTGSTDEYVWVFLISGAVPPAHLIDGWKGASGERQDPVYFRLGGSTIKGVSKPGEIVWSRIYVEDHKLKMDLGRGAVVELPEEETARRWNLTTPPWPIMHAVTYGVSRDQFMARHKANHIQVAYAEDAKMADKAMLAKASMARAMGMEVAICGTRKAEKPWG